MIWIVDGSRLVRDRKRFLESKSISFFKNEDYNYAGINSLPKNWLNNSVPVFFDFGADDWLYGLIRQINSDGLSAYVCVAFKI